MFRLLLLLLVLAGIAGYFTKPTEAQHREAASAAIRQLQNEAAANFDLGGLLETSIAQLSQEGAYTDYYVASRYTVRSGDKALAECWGVFGQVRCAPAAGAVADAANQAGGS